MAMPFRCAQGNYTHNEEPSLNELLSDPIVRLLMVCDHVDEATVRQLATEIACRSRP
jgi:hypothetical protein